MDLARIGNLAVQRTSAKCKSLVGKSRGMFSWENFEMWSPQNRLCKVLKKNKCKERRKIYCIVNFEASSCVNQLPPWCFGVLRWHRICRNRHVNTFRPRKYHRSVYLIPIKYVTFLSILIWDGQICFCQKDFNVMSGKGECLWTFVLNNSFQ